MSAFGDRVSAFLDEYFALNPVHATAAGMHAHDGEWPDLSDEGRAGQLDFVDRWERELRAMSGLTADEEVDRDLLLGELDAMRFDLTGLREEEWNPLAYVYLLGGGLFPLLTREFAPLGERLASVAGRLEGIPRVLEQARALVSGSARPVAHFHTEVALRQLGGVTSLADDAVAQAGGAAAEADIAELAPRLRAAADETRVAIQSFAAFLRDEVLPAAEGDGRLGPELFGRKLRHTFKSDLTAERILAQAEREYDAVRSEMIRIARQIWNEWMPEAPEPTAESEGSQEAADDRAVREVLAAIGRVHQKPADLLDFCRGAYDGIVRFCRESGLIEVPDEPLEIIWTPPFLREFAGAMLDSPGPLDKGEKAFFCVTPAPEEWTEEQIESWLAEDNDRMLRLLTIHEATPGHYLQGVYANQCPSIVRAVFWSGVFAEGWAVYVTQVMMDMGYGGDDPALMLTHWKFYLRAVINAIIDVRIHAGSMSHEEAMDLMVRGGFQEESEARKKWDRARLSSTQLSTYFVGSMEMWSLERERRLRLAAAAANVGDGASDGAVPLPRIVGGYGQTPGFVYKEHLERVLSHGSPPMPLLRRLVLSEG